MLFKKFQKPNPIKNIDRKNRYFIQGDVTINYLHITRAAGIACHCARSRLELKSYSSSELRYSQVRISRAQNKQLESICRHNCLLCSVPISKIRFQLQSESRALQNSSCLLIAFCVVIQTVQKPAKIIKKDKLVHNKSGDQFLEYNLLTGPKFSQPLFRRLKSGRM